MNLDKILNQKSVQQGLIVVVVILIFSFVWKRTRNAILGIAINDTRTNNSNDSNNLPNPVQFYKNFALKLKNAMEGAQFLDGWGLLGDPRTELFEQMIEMNDDEIVEISNRFNKIVNSPDTLTSWVNAEWMTSTTADNKILERLAALGLP